MSSVWRRLWGGVTAAFHNLKENYGDGARLSSAIWQEDKRQWHKLKQKRFRWGIRKKFFPQGQLGSGLPRETVQFPSSGALKTQLDQALEKWSELRAHPALSRRLN